MHTSPGPTWADLTEQARRLAEDDLPTLGGVAPTLLAYDGDALVVAIGLRPHPAGAYQDPMIEAIALAMPLGADRLAYVAGCRVWSLDDPVVPVADGVDLRQSAVVVVAVERDGDGTTTRTVILPYGLDDDGRPRWDDPVETDASGEGWIPGCLEVAVREGHTLTGTSPLEVGRQALRCVRLGHELGVPSGGDGRLAEAVLAALDSEARGEPQPPWVLSGPVPVPPDALPW